VSDNRTVVQVLDGSRIWPPPIWIMRQAGRYLPEYRQIRSTVSSFLELCYTPDLAVEVSLQPIRRYGFDAAILFSDILVIPDALGQQVEFESGQGPRLEPIDLAQLPDYDKDQVINHLSPVMETVSRLRTELPDETTLLGFCGAPWTVATYMIAGRGTPDQAPARLASLRDPSGFAQLIDLITDASIDYLIAQLKAGADAVQVFDTWAGVLSPGDFRRWSIAPMKKIVAGVRAEIPEARFIGFPKGANLNLADYVAETEVNGIGLDWSVPHDWARQTLQPTTAVQGNLDPMRLIAGGKALDAAIDTTLEGLGEGRLIFNLGHGITPETPVDHVAQLVQRVRAS